jgi:hypothetical protein
MNTEEMRRFVTSLDIYQSTRRNTREDLDLQQNHCGNLKNSSENMKIQKLENAKSKSK